MAWYQIAYGMTFQLLYSFITSCAGYAPFVLSGLIERYFEERKWKKLKDQQVRLQEQEMLDEEADYREGEDIEEEVEDEELVATGDEEYEEYPYA